MVGKFNLKLHHVSDRVMTFVPSIYEGRPQKSLSYKDKDFPLGIKIRMNVDHQ